MYGLRAPSEYKGYKGRRLPVFRLHEHSGQLGFTLLHLRHPRRIGLRCCLLPCLVGLPVHLVRMGFQGSYLLLELTNGQVLQEKR